MLFQLKSPYKPSGDQPQAIEDIVNSLKNHHKYQTLLGVTGSGKTFSMAQIINKMQMPTIILSHNKTLSAQLYREFKEFFPHNAVEYFVSYYDYYQPEAYVAKKDLYIEKDSSINEEIERLRIGAMAAMLQRKDVIIIATVSAIYGAGDPEDFNDLRVSLKVGGHFKRGDLLKKLVQIQYERNEVSVSPGTFRIKGDIVDIYSAEGKVQTRIEFFGDEVESIRELDPITGRKLKDIEYTIIYPAKAYVTKPEKMKIALQSIKEELQERIAFFEKQGRVLEAKRLETRTLYDLEMMEEMGFCKGIEHYSRHLALKQPGETPNTLLHFFPSEFLCFVDESHITLPQFGGMYNGDRSRKTSLAEYGFRLPSALDNRPLNFDEFLNAIPQFVFVSATPAHFELEHSSVVARQVLRPTGLVDPTIEVKSSENQFDDIMKEASKRIKNNERIIITTITKKLAEDISNALNENGFKVRYLHGEIETVERVEILTDLRLGVFDILVGINLLREGLDLPEVSLIAILDADKIGFLRSESSLIQIIGRAARNSNGHVIMYADSMSSAMAAAIKTTKERREIQLAYNKEHHITPQTITKHITKILERQYTQEKQESDAKKNIDFKAIKAKYNLKIKQDQKAYLAKLTEMMFKEARETNFEKASKIRDEIQRTQKKF
jgi:excinuclease ABC subunit B